MPPPMSAKTTKGTINAVPCPWCGHKNDLRNLSEDHILEVGAKVDCDRCHQCYRVTGVQTVQVVTVRQAPGKRPAAPGAPPPQPQKKPGVLASIGRALLGPPKR